MAVDLASELLAELGRPVSRDDEAHADLQERIARFMEQAQAAWPTLRAPVAHFIRFIAKRLPEGTEPAAGLLTLNAPGLYLACACAAGDSDAIAVLEAAYFGDCDAALARMGTNSGFTDDVKQRVRERLFVTAPGSEPRIATYGGRGDLRTFVRVVIMRQAISLRRSKPREVPLESGAWPWASADPELAHLREHCGLEFERAFREAVAALSSEERNLLRYHYLDGLTIDQLGAIYGVHRASAARRLTKVRSLLVDATRQALSDRLKLRTGELESVLRLIEGEVDVSLRRVLGDAQSRV